MRNKPLRLISLATLVSFGMALSHSALAQPGSPSSNYPGSSSSSPGPGSSPPSSSSSSPSSAGASPAFSKLDADGDGYISKKEAAKNKELLKKFDELDVNKTGKLSPADFAQFEAMQKSGAGSSTKP